MVTLCPLALIRSYVLNMVNSRSQVSQLLTPPESKSSSPNHGGECLYGDQGSLHGQQDVHQQPPSGVLSDKSQVEKLQGRSAMFAHPGQIVIEEPNGTMKMSTEGNVKITTETFSGGDQCNLGNLSMCGIRKIITEGVGQYEISKRFYKYLMLCRT